MVIVIYLIIDLLQNFKTNHISLNLYKINIHLINILEILS